MNRSAETAAFSRQTLSKTIIMRFTLVGNGRMGRQVAQVIGQSGCHETSAVLDIDTPVVPEVFQDSDAIIDFTVREAFLSNLPAML